MATIDSAVKRLLWVALALLVAVVACQKKPESVQPLEPVAEKAVEPPLDPMSGMNMVTSVDVSGRQKNMPPVVMHCESGLVKVVGSGKSTILTITIEATDRQADSTWSEIQTITNPGPKEVFVPLTMDSRNWVLRVRVPSYVSGKATVEFYQRCS